MLESKLLAFIYVLEKIKYSVLLFLRRKIKVILPIVVVSFILVPEIVLGLLLMIAVAIFSIFAIKIAITYFFRIIYFIFFVSVRLVGLFILLGVILYLFK